MCLNIYIISYDKKKRNELNKKKILIVINILKKNTEIFILLNKNNLQYKQSN